MKRFGLVAVVFAVLLFVSPVLAQETVKLVVYDDGYVRVELSILPDNYTEPLVISLVGEHVQDIVVEDSKGNPLDFEEVNGTLLIYPGSAGLVRVFYYTPDLTSKSGIVWTLNFSSEVPFTVVLPEDSIIVDLSDVPLRINGTSITMPPGNQSVSYIIETMPSPRGKNNSSLALIGGAFILGALFVTGFFFVWRKGPHTNAKKTLEELLKGNELRDEEKLVLKYLMEHGGRASQAEIRDALGIPKTTAWRMFKRLEEKGIVRVTRGRKENWVELNF